MSTPTDIAELIDGKNVDFKPVAYYDKHMDCIRIELRDCSIKEVRVSQQLTLLHDNHPSPHQSPLAGIMIKGVKHLFAQWDIPLEGVYFVTTIFDRLLQDLPLDPENVNQAKKGIEQVSYVAGEIDLTVDFNQELLAA